MPVRHDPLNGRFVDGALERAKTTRATVGPPSGAIAAIREAARQNASDRFNERQLMQQFFVSRLLDRVFTGDGTDDVEWLLKGGMRQLAAARIGRHTSDADLYTDLPLDDAIASLERRAQDDLADGIAYTLCEVQRYDHHPDAAQVTFEVTVDGVVTDRVEVDVSTSVRATCPARMVDPYNPLKLPMERPAKWRTYHPADQTADKVAATFEQVAGRPSRRYRDLVDIALIATTSGMRAGELRRAVSVECEHRGFRPPREFDVPDRDQWAANFDAQSAAVPELRHRGFDYALTTAKAFLDPVLAGAVDDSARWDRQNGCWTAS